MTRCTAKKTGKETGRPDASPQKLPLTERFGQVTSGTLTIAREKLPAISGVEFLRGKINQWLQQYQTRYIPLARRTARSAARFLDGARKVFIDLGFDGASMNDIARVCGRSQGHALRLFRRLRAELFEAIVEDEALEKARIAYNLDPARDVETTLREFGRTYIGSICRPGADRRSAR